MRDFFAINTILISLIVFTIFSCSAADDVTLSWRVQNYDDVTLCVNDSLTLNYSSGHTVVEVDDESSFTSCSGGTTVSSSGPFTVKFTEAKTYYFYCSVSSHCPPQRVKVVVIEDCSKLPPNSAITTYHTSTYLKLMLVGILAFATLI
mmetsp:Transcript_1747/g.2511  ORF Transcript_1747/g.2511 Transcript_1747/m.2511 type:complete len:148 (-) Transcript_1747:213-656(-)